jgi:hypothetical protein
MSQFSEGASVAKGVSMNDTIRRLKAEIERRGGRIHINDNLPDEITETFLREILACSGCAPRQAPQPRKQSSGH